MGPTYQRCCEFRCNYEDKVISFLSDPDVGTLSNRHLVDKERSIRDTSPTGDIHPLTWPDRRTGLWWHCYRRDSGHLTTQQQKEKKTKKNEQSDSLDIFFQCYGKNGRIQQKKSGKVTLYFVPNSTKSYGIYKKKWLPSAFRIISPQICFLRTYFFIKLQGPL
jgi:hypothetical protein